MPRWLHKRGLVWHYRFSAGGRDYSGSTEATDLVTAKLVLEHARQQAILMKIGQGKAPTLGEVIKMWTRSKGALAGESHQDNAAKATKALGKMLKVPIDHITAGMVQEWSAKYTEDHAPTTANLVIRFLKLWMRWAVTDKLIREMPCDLKPLKVQERRRPVVTDWRAFLDLVASRSKSPQIRPALATVMLLGLRIGELVQARWEWIEGDTFVVGGRTKSKKIRRIPIPSALLAEIHAYAGPELPRLGLMFPGEDGSPHPPGWLDKAVRRGGIGVHRLRATFATLHLRAKTNPKDVQEMLGHSSIATTMKYSEGSQEEKAKRQEELWA